MLNPLFSRVAGFECFQPLEPPSAVSSTHWWHDRQAASPVVEDPERTRLMPAFVEMGTRSESFQVVQFLQRAWRRHFGSRRRDEL